MVSNIQVSVQVINCIMKDYTGVFEVRLFKYQDNTFRFGLFCPPGTDTGHNLITSRFKSYDNAIKALYKHCIGFTIGDTQNISDFFKAERLKFEQGNKG